MARDIVGKNWHFVQLIIKLNNELERTATAKSVCRERKPSLLRRATCVAPTPRVPKPLRGSKHQEQGLGV